MVDNLKDLTYLIVLLLATLPTATLAQTEDTFQTSPTYLLLQEFVTLHPDRSSTDEENAAAEYLASKFGFDFKKALSGYAEAGWNARFQFVSEKNLLIDGAHNPEGVQALAQALKEFYPGRKFHFIAGCFADKNADEVVAAFAPLAADVSFIAFDGAGRETCSPEQLGTLLEKYAPGTPWKEGTLSDCLQTLPDPECMTVLCGSLHMCGEALELLHLPG